MKKSKSQSKALPARSWIEATFHGRECIRFIPNPKLEMGSFLLLELFFRKIQIAMGRDRRTRSRSDRARYSRTNMTAKSSDLSVGSPKRKRKREDISPQRRNKNAPRSPFINFFREYRSKHKNVPIVKMASNVSKIWNNMSTKQKKRYIRKNSKKRGNNSGLGGKKRKALTRTNSVSSVTQSGSQKSMGVTETTSVTETTVSRTHSNHSREENR